MEEFTLKHFLVGDALTNRIQELTSDERGRFKQRDFVQPLVTYCLSGNYRGMIGTVYGLRSTGKTVGMLQAAEELTNRGCKVAYARFNYDEFAMGDANIEIKALAEQGYSHFFVDEATYLEGFLNEIAEWPDAYVPDHKIKIVISGTDSFLINIARVTSLFHRCKQFSTNWCSFDEYRRVYGLSFETYKARGGIFTTDDIQEFIQAAVVENLLHTISHCEDDAERPNEYTLRLGRMDGATIFKAIISILKCSVEPDIIRHFVKRSATKNFMEFGVAIQGWTKQQRRELKVQVADAMSVYEGFSEVRNPELAIEALLSFLTKIGCLGESFISSSDFGSNKENIYFLTQNALIQYAIQETINGTFRLDGIEREKFRTAISQAAEGFVNESIVFSHVFQAVRSRYDKDKLFNEVAFKYRDLDKEIDIVDINRDKGFVRLIEVKSKHKIDEWHVFSDEAKHLYDDEILQKIGVGDDWRITRIVVYNGASKMLAHSNGNLFLANLEEFICHQHDLDKYLEQFSLDASK
jgi:predicted AAA+ superfamily ATPase